MKYTKNYFWLPLVVFTVGIVIGCSKNNTETSFGNVSGSIRCVTGRQGFKVTLNDPTGLETPQVVVTTINGAFYFENIKAGRYTIDVKRNGFKVGTMTVNGEIVYPNPNYVINVYKDQITNVLVQMEPTSEYIDDEITVTDMADNPIGNVITIPKYTTSIALKLYNGTSQNVDWSLRYNCFISGYKDTVVGDYEGYTYHTFDIFDDVSPSSGSLAPGDITVITGIINPEIYTLNRLSSSSYTKIILSTYNSIHPANKDIELLFPWGK